MKIQPVKGGKYLRRRSGSLSQKADHLSAGHFDIDPLLYHASIIQALAKDRGDHLGLRR